MVEPRTEDLAANTLTLSATDVEVELAELERLGSALERIELDSQEHLALAGRTLADAFACHARAVDRMRVLGEAVVGAHQRQRAHAAALEQTAQRLQQRSTEFAELTTELLSLGEETRAIALLLQALLPGSDAAGAAKSGDFAVRLEQALTRMDASVERARLLQQRARAQGIADLAAQAEALASQIAAAGARLRTPVGPART